ncbi:FAD-dependent oxidoreductase, partial [Bordetella pertussis]|uniref:FAD-dependent oxidoreductase n=1 Tax=Bordetella pertussis TaxID=520 RepID=UPI0003D3E190
MKTYDVVVVGAGMLGIAHAWAAARRGLSVAVVERSQRAHGATIRNFGQVLVTGQAPGVMARHARQSRELWLELAAGAGVHVRANGSL